MKHIFFYLNLGLLLVFSPLVQAKDSAVIVFDGSGSMKAKVEGKPKIEIAREVMGDLIKDWNEDIDLGLMIYGHRTKSCDDIEMVVPVGKPDGNRIIESIKSISPKGETPIGESLKQAADKLNYVESPTTVILISDGEESCNSDPCAVAKELEAKGVNFTAHVIGFDVSGEKQAKAQAQLKCVAESTGGKFFEAKNAESLKLALAETAKVVAQPAPVEKAEPIKVATEGDIIWEDSFERDDLGEAYEVVDADTDRMALSEGQIIMAANDQSKNRIRLKQTLEGDFVASLKVSSDLSPYNYAGIKFVADDTNAVGLWFGCFNPGISVGVSLIKYLGKDDNSVSKGSETKCKESEVLTKYLKLEKKGFNFKAYASNDGAVWDYVGEQTIFKKTGSVEIYSSKEYGHAVDGTFYLDDLVIRKLK